MTLLRGVSLLIAALALDACATVDPAPGLEHVRSLSATRTEADVVWVRNEAEAAQIRELVEALLADGLSRDEAVRIAVLNNPALQARLADIGIAAADVVEASLPTNPVLDIYWASPRRTGDSSIGLVGWLSDLWTLPRRKEVAALDARLTEYGVALDVMMAAIDAAHAWDRVVQSREELSLARELVDVRRKEDRRREIRFDHGLDDARLVDEAELRLAETEVGVHEFEQVVTEAETDFDRVLGLRSAAEHVGADASLAEYPPLDLTEAEALATGLTERLDLAMAEAEVERLSRNLGLQESLVWNQVALGVGRDGVFKETRGDEDSIGPVVSVDLPIFDRNQAGIARAEFEIEQAVQQLTARRQIAVKELLDRFRGYDRARQSLGTLTESGLPSAHRALAYMRDRNQAMQVAPIDMFESEALLLETRMAVVRARGGVNAARRGLELALRGGSSE